MCNSSRTPKVIFLSLLALLLVNVAFANDNFIIIRETEGIAVANYPFQFASPFLPGEIKPYPLVLIDGSAVTTQANVKQRYPDGSVKHAIISIIIPSIAANGTVTLTFSSQETGQDSPIQKADMLGAQFDFNAEMELTSATSVKVTAVARAMLQNGDYTVWAGGEIATTIILADHSLARKYDIGFDSYNSFRPIFHATFWPSLKMVNIRFIGELANTEALQNMNVSNLVLKVGSTSPQVTYSLPSANTPLTMNGGSRWTKQAWLGGTVRSTLNIYHNLEYLVKTRFVFNFDTSKVIPETTIASQYSTWSGAAKDLYNAGLWTKAQGTAGGRPDIGPYPDWPVAWLFTGDWRLRDQAFVSADLAAAWGVHFREGSADKRLLRSDTTNGTALGHVLAVTTRPTFTSANLNYSYTNAQDKVIQVGSTASAWVPDLAHSPDTWSPIYALTGDFWYLEELWFWASWAVSDPNGAAYVYPYGRGPTGAEGGLSGQIRGQAWSLRTTVNTVYVSPDDVPEKQYFTTMVEDAIAIEDGARNFTNSPYYGTPVWNWGNSLRFKPGANLGSVDNTLPPLNQWSPGSSVFAQVGYGIDTAVTSAAISLFEQNFLMISMGRAKELGFNCTLLVNYMGQFYVGALTDPGFNPYILGNGRVPTTRVVDNKYFPTFSDLKTGYDAVWQAESTFPTNDATHGYPFIAMAAVSMVATLPNGDQGWTFMKDRLLNATALTSNPKWAILPRFEDGIPNSPHQNQPYSLPRAPSSTVSASNQIHLGLPSLYFTLAMLFILCNI